MKTIISIVLFMCALLVSSCSDGVSSETNRGLLKNTGNENLYGTWVLDNYGEDYVQTMKKSGDLKENEYGFIFYRNGRFVERKNTSWCGTPPVVYGNYDGTWAAESDSIISITAAYWGGISEYKIKIVSLTESEFKFRHVYPE